MTRVERVQLHYNNVYLAGRGGSRVLVDTGPDYDGAREALLAACGGRGPDIVIATHGHMDHASLGHWWQEQGVPVAVGAADVPHVEAPPAYVTAELAAQEAYIMASGAPQDVAAEARSALTRRRTWAAVIADPQGGYLPATRPGRWPTHLRFEPFVPMQPLEADASLAAGLTAWLSPGHTPGNLVLVDEPEGWLFSGDQLLPDLTPVPAFQLAADGGGRFRSLPAFVASLRRLLAPGFARCFPGHGEPFDNVSEVVQANLDAIEERTARVAAELRAGPSTVYGLAERIYPRAVRRRFWQIVPSVQGHLDLLQEMGAVRIGDAGYEPAP